MANPSMHLPRRGGGMQVHAVPENERAIDPLTGKRLPWSYDYADPDKAAQRRVPEERGPFGRSTNRRGASRSKTFTPVGVKPQDKDALENQRVIDDIFTRAKENTAGQRSNAPAQGEVAGQNGQTAEVVTPTEVILYGFPEPYQYAAIEFYERVSGGAILEDYERFPPNTRYNLTLSRNVPLRPTSLPPGALTKVNNYHGGEHWIKVTFNSADAADRACYYSPHTVQGHAIFAERYRGEPPARDEALPATAETLASIAGSPSNHSSATVQPNGHHPAVPSSTATSQTAGPRPSTPEPILVGGAGTTSSALAPEFRPRPKTPLIRGASRAVLLPADTALLPATSRWQRTFGAVPLASFLVAGTSSDRIVSEVPVREDGNFDWDNASLYWLFWALLDYYFWFCNFLGLKGED